MIKKNNSASVKSNSQKHEKGKKYDESEQLTITVGSMGGRSKPIQGSAVSRIPVFNDSDEKHIWESQLYCVIRIPGST